MLVHPAMTALQDLFEQQQQNWLCWAAVLFGSGIAIYFSLADEPSIYLAPMVAAFGLGLMLVGRRRQAFLPLGLAIALLAAGWTMGQVRTRIVEAPILAQELKRASIEGEIEEIELLPSGQRVTLRNVRVDSLDRGAWPYRARLRVGVDQPNLRVGEQVKGRADLLPPRGPNAPGAFDFRRDAYFRGLGAIGFVYGRLNPEGGPSPDHSESVPFFDRAAIWIANLRHAIALRILDVLPERSGALAVALIVGDQRAIPAADVDAMRDSGLAHILSISGLHIGLAAGLIFISARAALALFVPIALRHPTKKYAAILAIAAAFAYAILAGWTTPTARAFVMSSLALLAIVFDRSPISMRLLALAAFTVLVAQPEALVGASFQMSFAAVFILIAGFKHIGPWLSEARKRAGFGEAAFGLPAWLIRAWLWLLATIVSSLLAGLATTPFVVAHFNRLAVYGVAANALAVPLTGFWIMPMAVVVLLSMPLGLQEWPLRIMGAGCELLLSIAGWFASLPAASIMIPAPASWALAASTAGLLLIGLFKHPRRWLGLLPIAAAMASGFAAEKPVILVSPNGDLVGFRGPGGELVMSKSRGSELSRETWLRESGLEVAADVDGAQDPSTWLYCTADHCRWRGPFEISVVLEGDIRTTAPCKGAMAVIAPLGSDRAGCSELTQIFDRQKISAAGGMAVFVEEGILRVQANSGEIDRPWSHAKGEGGQIQ
jgi:competence protein ComEC